MLFSFADASVHRGSFMLEPCFPAASIRLHSSMIHGWLFTRIASSKVPFLTSSEADRAFQAVRDFDVELALFYSYHLDRFGHSVAASPANR